MNSRNREVNPILLETYRIEIPYPNNVFVSSNQLRLLSIQSLLPLDTQNRDLIPANFAEKTVNTEETNPKVVAHMMNFELIQTQ